MRGLRNLLLTGVVAVTLATFGIFIGRSTDLVPPIENPPFVAWMDEAAFGR